jgi:transaldolase
MNPSLALRQCGQAVWLDHISRSLITGGGLQRLIDEDGLGGVTSNPTIFDKAIAGSTDYDAALHRAVNADRTINNRALAEQLIVEGSSRTSSWRLTCFDQCTTTVTGQTVRQPRSVARLRVVKAAALGLDLHAITEQLQADGIKAFAASFDQLLATVAERRREIVTPARQV